MASSAPEAPDHAPSGQAAILVWDLPLRLCHWFLAILVVVAVVSGREGGDAMDLHLQAGYGVAILVVFRLFWGFLGTPYARFRHFLRGPGAILAYCRQLARGEKYGEPGHNPLGGWFVAILLAALAFQAATGLFANDDILTEGPLFSRVSKEASDYLTALHKLNFRILLGLAGLHLAAIAFYSLVKRLGLLGAMVTGRARVAPHLATAGIRSQGRSNVLALVLLALAAGSFYWLVLIP